MKQQPSQTIYCVILGRKIPEERCAPSFNHYCRECPHSSKLKNQQSQKIVYPKIKPKNLYLFGDLADSNLPEKLKEVFKSPYTTEKIREVLGLSPQPTKEDHKLLSEKLSIRLREMDTEGIILAVELYVINTLMFEAALEDSKRRADLKKIQKMIVKQITTSGEDVKSLCEFLYQTTAKLQKIPIDKGERPRFQIQPKTQSLAILANIYERNTGRLATGYEHSEKLDSDTSFPEFARAFFTIINDPPPNEQGFSKLIYRALEDRPTIIPSQVP